MSMEYKEKDVEKPEIEDEEPIPEGQECIDNLDGLSRYQKAMARTALRIVKARDGPRKTVPPENKRRSRQR